MSVEIVPLRGIPEVRPGDDVASLVLGAVGRDPAGIDGLQDGDILVLTQKVVSKAEGRLVPEGAEGKSGWAAREARRVVARRGDLLIAETRHGFVCANAGVDASNVEPGWLTLLPEDPDGSAERIRTGLEASTGLSLALVVTDTFGRPWRKGLVDVAIGCAGLPSLVDLRGSTDALGRRLDVTVIALADQIAAAAGLVMGKADGVPAAIVRGVRREGPGVPARALVRPPEEDLFRESPLEAIGSARPATAFGPGDVARDVVLEAVGAACPGTEPGGAGLWRFDAAWSEAARRRLLGDAMRATPSSSAAAERLAGAACLVMPLARTDPPVRKGFSFDETALLWGAVVQRFLLALHAQGLAARWEPPVGTGQAAEPGWRCLGLVGIGRLDPDAPASHGAEQEPREDPSDLLRDLG